MDSLTSLRVFCTVADKKGFTAAAERLGISPAMASKHVMHLESRLSIRLLNRTSRHVSLTETGKLYYQQVRQMLDGLDEVEAAISNIAVLPRGTLRISAPVWFANPLFTEILADYGRCYPDVCFDVDLNGKLVSLVDEGIDLALRSTDPASIDPSLIARPLADVSFSLVASPDYLDRAGRPTSIAELNGHALLMYSGIHAQDGAFPLDGPLGPETVKFRIKLQSHNETLLHLAALKGMGMVLLPKWMTGTDLAEGKLEVVLANALQMGGKLFAVYPSRKYLSAKVRTFIDFLANDHRLK